MASDDTFLFCVMVYANVPKMRTSIFTEKMVSIAALSHLCRVVFEVKSNGGMNIL